MCRGLKYRHSNNDDSTADKVVFLYSSAIEKKRKVILFKVFHELTLPA